MKFALATDPNAREFLNKLDLDIGRKAALGDPDRWHGTPVFGHIVTAHEAFRTALPKIDRLGNDMTKTPHVRHEFAQQIGKSVNADLYAASVALRTHAENSLKDAEELVEAAFRLDDEPGYMIDRRLSFLEKQADNPEGHLEIRKAVKQDKGLLATILHTPKYITKVTPELQNNLMSEAIDQYVPVASKKINEAQDAKGLATKYEQHMRSVTRSFGNDEMARIAEATRVEI